MHRPPDVGAERVLVLAPTGRDAEMMCERIVADGMSCEVFADLDALLSAIPDGAGAAVIAHEAMPRRAAEDLLTVLEAQEPWSDLEVLLLYDAKSNLHPRVLSRFFERTNVNLLPRPLPIDFFLSSVRAALRARRRQYAVRDLYRDLERALQLSDMFVGILGHDLRNPLGAIRLGAENIAHSSTDDVVRSAANRIVSSADRATRLIEQLLDFARARRGGGIPLKLGPAHLGEICLQVIQELEDANPGAKLRYEEAGSLTGVWDADRLAQVVMNLVRNAIQHGTKGEHITVEADGTNASTVMLRVRSAGTIPTEALPTLFEAFRRAGTPASPRAKGAGLGLGLFIAREVARAHGGELGVKSTADRVTFEMKLPREGKVIDTGALTTI